MKKMILCLCLLLVGCSKKESTTICALTQENAKIVNTIISQDDKVIKQTLENEINYKNLELTKEDVVELANEYVESYDLEGLSYSFEVNEEHLLETIMIDYSTANIQELMNIGLIESVDDAQYISLKQTLTTLKDTGFICE